MLVVAIEAGADMVAPSGMMDGQVAAIRAALDEGNIVRETLGAIKRAGADLILTYFARDVLRQGF